jgi:primosomal protein N' (replication factor Y) (superfamily II helicase)
MLVEVVLPLPLFRSFTYSVADELRAYAVPGTRVRVPFGRRERVGWIERVTDEDPSPDVLPVRAVLESTPAVTPEVMHLCRWLADYYVTPLALVIRTTIPAALSAGSTESIQTTRQVVDSETLSDMETEVLAWLADGEAKPVARLRRERGDRSWWPVIDRMRARGLIRTLSAVPRAEPAPQLRQFVRLTREIPSLRERDEVFGRARRQRECWEWLESVGGVSEVAHLVGRLGFSRGVVSGLVERGVAVITEEEVRRDPYGELPAPPPVVLTPTAAQAAAIARLTAAAAQPRPLPVLLRGVTGSGKTLVYIELLREVVVRQGRTAIVLVPEIALTPQTVGRFRAEFGDRVAVLHSALSDGERYDEWRALKSGEKSIAVGARSAVFAPLRNLGAIIVDEEHEASYKQGEAPRYHAREVAVVRASLEGAVCVLGSATPSLESWANATSGKFDLIDLPDRAAGQPMPSTRVVDLRAERKKEREEGRNAAALVLSRELREAIDARLERAEQTILLLNRRGYSNFVQCRDCGQVWDCPSCAVSLTYHRRRGRLTCHYCLYEEDPPAVCTRCGSTDVSFRGIGTEQVERTVEETFPSARIARMDVDTTSARWAHHQILDRVGSGEIDILLGTQMIAKGLDFPNVTLVGVVNADVGLNLPDFRATERAFQLITQVAGRAGRGPKGGEVLIQTSLPDHYAITCSLAHDFHAFAARELEARRSPLYPPYCKLVNVVISGLDEVATQELAQRASDWLKGLLQKRSIPGIQLIGPAPCPIERMRDRWRWHFLLRATNSTTLGRVTRYFAERFRPTGGKHHLRVTIDRDPVALL